MNRLTSRRQFLRTAAALAGGTLVMADGVPIFAENAAYSIKRIWRLNPAFRIKELSNTEIELYTHLKTGELLAHRFSGLEADLLRSISEESKLESLLPEFARRQKISISDCQRRMNALLDEFVHAHLIYAGDKMIVRKVEIIHE